MNDPERLLEGGGSELERELLGALASEKPAPALARRMRHGLFALGLLTTAKTSVAGVVALLGVLSVGAGAAWVMQREHVAARSLPAGSVSAVSRVVASAVRPAPPPPSAEPANLPPATAPRSNAAAAPSSTGDLREQIALLDRARAAVRARNSQVALAELAAYRKQFPRGEFSQEVTVLKVEALVQAGQLDGARALGKRFLAAHPESPHVERIERLIR